MKEFKRYERYKDSGVEWIREIPEHWKTTRLKYLKKSPFMYGANESAELDNPNLPRFIRITDIDFNGNLKEETFKSLPLELAEPYLLEEGDILFARSGASVGKTFIYERKWGPACFAGYLIRFQTDESKAIPKFIYYFCQTSIYEDWIKENTIQSTIQNVSAEKYSSLILPVPPLNTQNIIVNYLDQKTAEIDSLIADKEKLIELLQEQRQAIITQAVTKGLDPNVPMKDSRLKWWGVVPEHWKYLRMDAVTDYHKCNIRVSELMGKTVFHYSIPVIEEIGDGKYEEGEDINSDKVLLNGNEILVSKLNPQKSRIVLVEPKDVPIVCSTEFVPLIPKQVNRKYFWYLYQSEVVKQRICSSVQSATNSHQRANLSDIIKIWFYLPEKEEQQAIASYLDKKTAEIDSLVTTIKKQMAFLKEYRRSLITAAITGKIDVQDYCSYSIRSEQMEKEEQEEVS